MSMNYKLLPSDEWHRLHPLFEGRTEFLPTPDTATAAIAEDDDGHIQGVLFLQLQLHMEPLLIRSPEVNFMRLTHTLESAIADRIGLCYFAFTDDPKIERMAELAGLTRMSYTIWRKEVV